MADLPELMPSQDDRGSYYQPKHSSATYSLQSPSQPYTTEKEAASPQEGGIDAKSRLKGRTFWGLIILVVVIIAGAIGGGIGGALAVQHAKSKTTLESDAQPQKSGDPQITAQITATVTVHASATSTSASASFSATSSAIIVPDPSSVQSIDISCPEPTMVSWKGEGFSCQETTQVSPSISTDLTGIVAYSLQTCIDACSTWNQLKGGGCLAVSMEWDLSYAYQTFQGANCFLRGTDSPTSSNPNVTSLILS